MIRTLATLAVLTTTVAAGPHQDNKRMVYEAIGYQDPIMATARNFDLPDTETVADGTSIVDEAGLSNLFHLIARNTSGFQARGVTIESYTDHPVYPDGTRYLKYVASGATNSGGDPFYMQIDDPTTEDAEDYYGIEFGIEYILTSGTAPTSLHRSVHGSDSDLALYNYSLVSGGITNIGHYTDLLNDAATGETEIAANGMNAMRYNEPYRIGWGIFRDTDGYMFSTIDGHITRIQSHAETDNLSTLANISQFVPLDAPNVEVHITGPFKTWDSADLESELIVPDSDDENLGVHRYLRRQINDQLGPYESSGAGTVTWPDLQSEGISSNRHSALTAGGAVTLTLRDGHGIDTLPTFNGFACIRVMDIYGGVSSQNRLVLYDDVDTIVDFTIDGDDSFKFKISSSQVGTLAANATDRFEVALLISPDGNNDCIILNNISNETAGDQNYQVVAWDRGADAGTIPSLTGMTVQCYDAGAQFGGIWATPGYQLLFSSSFLATPEEDPSPDITAQNHLGKFLDGYSGPWFTRGLTGVFGPNCAARSGQDMIEMRQSCNDWEDLGLMGAGLHIWCIEWVVNQQANVAGVTGEMELLIDAAYDAGNWITIVESVYQPDNETYDEDFRDRQEQINAAVKSYLLSKGAGSRFRWLPMINGRTYDQTEAAYFITSDGIHPGPGIAALKEDAINSELFVLDMMAATPETASGVLSGVASSKLTYEANKGVARAPIAR